MNIRRTVEEDIPALAAIVSENYSKEFAEHFVPEIELSFAPVAFRPWFYTAVDETDNVIGCAGYVTSWISYGAFTLCWVNVDRRKRLTGVGRALVDRCMLDLSKRANLVILATTVPDFYEKNWKFRTVGTFHGDQMTDTLMVRNIGPDELSDAKA